MNEIIERAVKVYKDLPADFDSRIQRENRKVMYEYNLEFEKLRKTAREKEKSRIVEILNEALGTLPKDLPQLMRDIKELVGPKEEIPKLRRELAELRLKKEMEERDIWGAQGYLGLRQLQKLDKLLDELAANPAVENVILVLHRHPFDYLFYHGLRDHPDLKGVISQRPGEPPRVNVLLFGHKHLDHRFNDPVDNKESLFGVDMIFASGQTVERNENGKMTVPVIDLKDKTIQRYLVS